MSSLKALNFAVALGALAALAGCASEPPYFGPLGPGHTTGYTDQQIAQNRYRVTYEGDSETPRVTVENFLLLRAAQVARQAGYPAFLFDTRDTKAKTQYFSSFTGWPGWGGYGIYGWGPGGWPYDVEGETRPVTRYEAYAEIVLLTDEEAKKEPRALAAQSVIDHLGPLVFPAAPN